MPRASRGHRGLQHELYGFGDRHEVAGHVRMRHRDRSPRASCFWKSGTTLPSESSTFPKRTAGTRLHAGSAAASTSAPRRASSRPSRSLGCTALSVEISTKPRAMAPAASRDPQVPNTLLRTASADVHLHIGTCLYAAAWKT